MTSFILIVAIVVLLQLGGWRKVARQRRPTPSLDALEQAIRDRAPFDPAAYVEPAAASLDDDGDDRDWTAPPPPAPPPVIAVAPASSDFAGAVMRLAYAPGLCSPRPASPVLSPRQE